MSGCLPCCSELLATLSRRSVSRDGCSLASLEAELDLGIEALQEDVILKVLELLPASALARLRALGGGSLQARPVHLAALVSRHPALGSSLLASSAGLRAVHVREAELLSFAWCGAGGRLASGEDGWSTDLGSAVVGRRWPEPAPVSGRRRWMLELLRLDGLLAVGLADGRLQNNAFLGSDSNFRWLAFGWELGPRGFFEAVSSTPPVRSGRDLAVAKHTLALSPGRRVVLVLHLICDGPVLVLELHAQLQEPSFPGEWRWQCLGSQCFDRPSHWDSDLSCEALDLRPAVSTDIGAAVRVLAGDVAEAQP
ncbi:unnamed protein product [Polarella glacialis]|uniref:Uncharacterized protein n=1 Tax=Polarella glacialis TaxID=89957 RepID=A0A813HL42_POLGL|nr:unnamed protein product [Polarella glacialis]